MASIIFPNKSLDKVILEVSNRPNRIVQMNVLHAIYSVIVLEIFEVKVVYAIYPWVYTSMQYGSPIKNTLTGVLETCRKSLSDSDFLK